MHATRKLQPWPRLQKKSYRDAIAARSTRPTEKSSAWDVLCANWSPKTFNIYVPRAPLYQASRACRFKSYAFLGLVLVKYSSTVSIVSFFLCKTRIMSETLDGVVRSESLG